MLLYVLDGWSLSGFKVIDANGQSLAYVYSRETKDAPNIAKVLTEDEARRIASNIAKLPVLLQLGNVGDFSFFNITGGDNSAFLLQHVDVSWILTLALTRQACEGNIQDD